ncbi:hypothetical protein [Methylophilus sp. TWE2]|uniref:hypothetical protein n=1 Tax=Methylophilus sp. TWE2 TaxID=1662285 RepID=UPI000670D2E4|nr:hypothetical protein [Methylophilus sp. TWE2]AKR42712.1 hypothetical protein ACJ67_04215 [Methylophilus sp. TWE2]
MFLTPSYSPNPIIVKGDLVQRRLRQLHDTLNEDVFKEASDAGFTARLEATPAHAPTAAGSLQWHETVFALRTQLALRKWRIVDTRNCPLIVSPDKNIMIAIMTGDKDTGMEFGDPRNQGAKGTVLSGAIQKNLELFSAKNKANKDGTQLWVLLYHVVGAEVRRELSIPNSFYRGKITGWSERILLGSMQFNSQPDVFPISPTDDLDFDVIRKKV